ncbi:MAG: ATPase, partial [Bacteroidetes bacterium]|nr:ATPase [Bacteroidota bacterium]
DSGSTKVAWRVVHPDGSIQKISTSGINPVFLSHREICAILEELRAAFKGEVGFIHFYAAGVTGPQMEEYMQECFQQVFPKAVSTADSDMVAAARALCGNKPGIACILGTGSNSCFYDGQEIMPGKVPAGGFILGDEGGGAVLGRKLLSDFIKRQLPPEIERAFKTQFPDLDINLIIQKVYREPIPGRFLASFSPFLHEYSHNQHINNLLHHSFAEFFSRNVAQYEYKHYPVNMVGSIAHYYQDIIGEEAQRQGMTIGKILKTPIEGLLAYHIAD